MAKQPVSILSYRVDPEGVLALVRELAPGARAEGDDSTWRLLEVPATSPSRPRPSRPSPSAPSPLVLTHVPESYRGETWASTVGALRERCKGFPPTGRTSEVVRALSGVGFRLDLGPGCVVDLDDTDHDQHSAIVLAVAEHLDAFLLTPSSVRDHRGRVLIGDDPCDPEALLPAGSDSMPNRELLATIADGDGRRDPSPVRVARRALALAAVSSRAFLEQMDPGKVDLDVEHARLRGWAECVDLSDELEPDEWQLLQAPVSYVDERDAVDAAWRLEGLTVLSWALERSELPPYDAMVKPTELYPSIAFLDPDADAILTNKATLVARHEIECAHRRLFTVRWRIRELRRTGESLDLTTAPTVTRAGSLDFSGCRLIDGELAIGRLPIDVTPADQVKRVDDIVLERLLALQWLLDGGTYSHISLPI
ncbi:MAG: DUF4272 domain-containing protein [Actinobacteria bacterium]|nr:DUF4272 domain-containing protein [Actinomycetota bacterium]